MNGPLVTTSNAYAVTQPLAAKRLPVVDAGTEHCIGLGDSWLIRFWPNLYGMESGGESVPFRLPLPAHGPTPIHHHEGQSLVAGAWSAAMR